MKIFKLLAAESARAPNVKNIDATPFPSHTLSLIAEAQAENGDAEAARKGFAEAKSTVAAIKQPTLGAWDPKSIALEFIAKVEASAGDIAEAKRTADCISNYGDKLSALGGIAKAQAAAGDVTGAKDTATPLKDARERGALNPPIVLDGTLRYIGIAQAKAGDISGAKSTAAAIRDAGNKREVLERIAAAQAISGDLSAAETTVVALSPGFDRCFGNLAIAKGLLGLRDEDDN